ncbi:unnamed protein product [Darwinula stevensoni]|uniref:Uncharacterized protein n=1 Tax=Darwinula stevensoni TaxID=69355 RepID=A0A7R9ACL0_9CRUS|nr:unnamed protein product [Darwinula stevensoni]CAG0900471.1 unnamed protein product [Darwinula stevensoni]
MHKRIFDFTRLQKDVLRNGTVDGPYLVGTGKEDSSDFGRIHLWQGEPSHYKKPWGSDECNAINGTDGTVFPPLINKETLLYTFIPELCRSVHLKYEKEVDLGGIPGFRFVLHPDSVSSADVRPENKCFCVDECLGAGLLDVTNCYNGKQFIMSSPHFYVPEEAGDTGYNESLISGLEPLKDLHETFFDIEPRTGSLLRARKRLQTNVKVRPFEGYNTFKNIPKMEIPVFWVEEITDDQTMERRLRPVVDVGDNFSMGARIGIACGVLALSFLISIACWCCKQRRRERRQAAVQRQ